MKINRSASAAWSGGLRDGRGSISTESGALSAYPYGFAGRFTMALSLILGEAKFTAEQMDTTAKVTLDQADGGFSIPAVHLTLRAKIPGIDQATFEELAAKAKAGCPLSKVLKANITLD